MNHLTHPPLSIAQVTAPFPLHSFKNGEGMGNGGWVRTLLCLLLLASSSLAKSAEDYLHGAFYKYIDNRMQEAGVEVEEGLQNYPDDPKLQNLNDLLKQMKKSVHFYLKKK